MAFEWSEGLEGDSDPRLKVIHASVVLSDHPEEPAPLSRWYQELIPEEKEL